jgi:3-isopropylmalate/(R)-2-methylmalate dehydratase small subunit
MATFTTLTSRLVPIAVANIDTDQIIPARYLKVTSKSGLGKGLFSDWRYNEDGSPKDFILNRPEIAGAEILLAGDNFGCGSSREHAPWALTDFGFRAVISTSIADIFRNNSLKNGLLPVIVDADTLAHLFAVRAHDTQFAVSIDLASQTLSIPGRAACRFPIDAFSKHCLLNGVDELGFLQSHLPQIEAYERARSA